MRPEVAQLAGVRLLSRVKPDVLLQHELLGVDLGAVRALELSSRLEISPPILAPPHVLQKPPLQAGFVVLG